MPSNALSGIATDSWWREFSRNRSFLEEEKGVVIMRGSERAAMDIAMDAQPSLATSPNTGIPAFLSFFIWPDLMKVLFSPLNAEKILGDAKMIGDWTTTTSIFPLVEDVGQVSSYGDYANSGYSSMNATFPERQSYTYQAIIECGDREIEMMALAKVNLVAAKRESMVRALNTFQNLSYFFGVQGLQNYGFLNDPSFSAAIQPGPKAYQSEAHGPWITWSGAALSSTPAITATPVEIYSDFLALFVQLQAQTNGVIALDMMSPLTLAMHPTSLTAFRQANTYGVTAEKLMKENFPNCKIVQAVQYAPLDLGGTNSGFTVQLIATEVEGQESAFLGFTEKLRAHRLIYHESSFRQKISQGTWGAVNRLPAAFATMVGV